VVLLQLLQKVLLLLLLLLLLSLRRRSGVLLLLLAVLLQLLLVLLEKVVLGLVVGHAVRAVQLVARGGAAARRTARPYPWSRAFAAPRPCCSRADRRRG
jgi:hypothetical protein